MKLALEQATQNEDDQREMERWLKAKEGMIGGSSAATAAGVGRHGSRLRLWMEMTGRQEREDIGHIERVHWGNVLEPVVTAELEERTEYRLAKYAGERLDKYGDQAHLVGEYLFKPWTSGAGERSLAGQQLFVSNELPWQSYSPDAFATNGDGELGLVETKTAGTFMLKEWDDEPPLEAIVQVQHGMAVLGLPWAVLPVLIGGQDFRVYQVKRDEELIELLVKGESDFMFCVENDTAPDLESPLHPDTLKALKLLHPADNGKTITLPHEAEKLDAMRTSLKDHHKMTGAKLDEIEAQLRVWLGPNTYGQVPGTKIAFSLKTQERKGYTKTYDPTTYRTLRRKEAK